MFRPGHLVVRRDGAGPCPGYFIDMDYQLRQRDRETYVHFDLRGEVAGRGFHDTFELHRDVAYNFLQSTCRRLRRHGFPPHLRITAGMRGDYERVFADLRRQLHAAPGTPVDLGRFLLDRSL
ncbi:DUF5064 domain-containing protein [Pseudomonas tohonis]|uniref:DUF5064 domain-containing protein n=1 Tax=Pseudomonas tohonis TaxID=2725477 RepID=A0A6J4ED96_9PSED|nr:DUF5064 family protein [Pseudomonas tohonis]BCG27600.1 DUF5064 domain-containing protein [Pseudomonas tohonis]GJN53096.1 DUF5064 domain-containing protein [Pseudomonas tohonis]